ncbi:MAG: YIP1 family protein [Nitrosopumilus sp.]
MTAPNSAFAEIRDNEEKYFVQSIGILIAVSFLTILVIVPFLVIPFDDVYLEEFDNFLFGIDNVDIVLSVISSIITGFVSAALSYFIGKKIGGNKNWKKVFSVVLHTNVIVFPMMLIFSLLVFLMLGSLVSLDIPSLVDEDLSEQEALTAVGPMLGYVGLIVVTAIVFVIWIIVVSVKALKVVNDFETGKAFGLLILVMILSSIATIPLGL